MLVTTPTRSCAKSEDASNSAAAPVSNSAAMTRFARPIVSSAVGASIVSHARGEESIEQAKCYRIPDFHKIRLKGSRSFGSPATNAPRATLEPDWQLLVSLAVSSTQFRILAFVREWDYARPHSRISPDKGAGYVAQRDVGRQPHGSHLPAAGHVHLAHAVDVARSRAAGRRARRPQGVGVGRRCPRAVGR